MQTNFTLAQLTDPQNAASEKILRACVHCGFCTATCPTYVLLGDELDSPRGRIYLIKEMLEQNRPATRDVVKHIDRCLSCLACMTTCPSGVNYMHLVDHGREHIEKTYKRPIFDRLLRAVLALPVVIVAFLFVVALGPSPRTLIIVIGFVFTPLIARTVRSAVLSERELDYIAAARLRGERAPYIMFAEILPNVLQPILVEFTVRVGYAIFAVATLSFLGFGIQPPTADWGADISVNYAEITAGYWWEVLFPALAIASLVVAVNLIADSISGVLEG